MSTVNFNDTTPTAPTGMTNVKWQSDASGNVSAYDPGAVWTNYTPTISPQGGMTLSSVTITYARYLRMGPLVFFQFDIGGTIGGTLSNSIWLSLPPITPVAPGSQLAYGQPFQGTTVISQISITTTEIRCAAAGGVNFLAGGITLFGAGFYGAV